MLIDPRSLLPKSNFDKFLLPKFNFGTTYISYLLNINCVDIFSVITNQYLMKAV